MDILKAQPLHVIFPGLVNATVDVSLKQVPPSFSPITEKYNQEAVQLFASKAQVRIDRVTDTLCIQGWTEPCQDLRLVWLQIVDCSWHQNFTATTTIFTVKPTSSTASSPTTFLPHLLIIMLTKTSISSGRTEDTEGGNGKEETSCENRPYRNHQYCPHSLYCTVCQVRLDTTPCRSETSNISLVVLDNKILCPNTTENKLTSQIYD